MSPLVLGGYRVVCSHCHCRDLGLAAGSSQSPSRAKAVGALWGTTAFGNFHQMLEYMIMIRFSERNWVAPPGTGYLTVAVITISAILIVTLRTPQRHADELHQDDHSGSPALA
jgi:hypothetical protein